MQPADPGFGCHILKLPVSQVPVQFVFRIEAAEKQVAQAVAIVVASGHTRSIEIDLIRGVPLLGQAVDKANAGQVGGKCSETGLAVGRDGQRLEAIAIAGSPIARRRSNCASEQTQPE